MEATFLAHEVSDLCLGKPALRSLPISSTTIADALAALKVTGETYLSVWNCDHHNLSRKTDTQDCRCVGKLCMVDIICYLAREENISNPSSALKSPISAIIPKVSGLIQHVEPHVSLLESIDLMLEGAQNLVIPIRTHRKKALSKPTLGATTTIHNGLEYCWITQEDMIRHLLNSIGLFSSIPAYSIESLGLVRIDLHAIDYHKPASSAVNGILDAHAQQTSVAVVDEDGILIGEISPFALALCDETASAAIATLSAGDLMAYVDYGGPPEDIVRVVKARLAERKLEGMLDLIEEEVSVNSSGSDSDEEFLSSPTATLSSSNSRPCKYSRFGSFSTSIARRAEAIVCHPQSSLVAVMVQALAHRVNYVWVLEDDYSLAGIVKFSDMLNVFWERFNHSNS